jgi:Patatin-like phospholipase
MYIDNTTCARRNSRGQSDKRGGHHRHCQRVMHRSASKTSHPCCEQRTKEYLGMYVVKCIYPSAPEFSVSSSMSSISQMASPFMVAGCATGMRIWMRVWEKQWWSRSRKKDLDVFCSQRNTNNLLLSLVVNHHDSSKTLPLPAANLLVKSMVPPANAEQALSSRKRVSDGLVDPSLGRLQKAAKTVAIARLLVLEAKATGANRRGKRPPADEIPPPRRSVRKQLVDGIGIVVAAVDDEQPPTLVPVHGEAPQLPRTRTSTTRSETTSSPCQSTGNKPIAITPGRHSPARSAPSSLAAGVVIPSSAGTNNCTGTNRTGTNLFDKEEEVTNTHAAATLNETVQATTRKNVNTRLERATPLPSLTPISPGRTTTSPPKQKMSSHTSSLTTTITNTTQTRSCHGTNNVNDHRRSYGDEKNDMGSIGSSDTTTPSSLDRVVRLVQLLVPILFLITSARSMVFSIQRSALTRSGIVNAASYAAAAMASSSGNTNLTLRDILTDHDTGFHLAMAPAFFGFYGYFGALAAWYDLEPNLPVRSLAGASAGAMAAILMGAGISPQVAADFCADMTLSHFADFPGFGAVFRGHKFERLMDDFLTAATNRTRRRSGPWP